MTFWDRLQQKLLEKKISESDLSRAVGLTQASITGWKKRNAIPSADIAVKVAYLLETTVEFLITGKGKKNEGLTDKESKALLQLQSLTEVNQNAVFTLIDALYKQERGIL